MGGRHRDGRHSFPKLQCPGTGRTFNHFTHPSRIWLTSSVAEPCQRWAATDAGSAALDLLWGEVSWLQWPSKKKTKKSIRLGLHDANLVRGRGIHANVLLTKGSCLLLICGTKLLACCQAGSSSQTSTARDRVGEMGWEGRAGPALTAASPGARPLFILPYVDLSMCSPMCHM